MEVHNQWVNELDEIDVARLVGREFPDCVQEAMDLLEVYGREDWHREVHRVRIAILKLANRELKDLHHYVGVACSDYRDVLMWAEFPNYNEGPNARAADAESYRKWIAGSPSRPVN